MKWFDTKEIKDREKLSPEQITYLKKPSLTFLGPLNIVFRRHWDIVSATLFVIFVKIVDTVLPQYGSYLWNILISIFVFWLFYFSLIHGRRLTWNRNNWENFEKLRVSGRKWMPWGILFFIVSLLLLLISAIP